MSKSLSDQAYATLRQALLTNEMAPGSVWSDREICEKFELSRTPVREALLRLQAEQIVEILPRKGTRVLPLLMTDVEEIHQVTKALELEAAMLIAEKGPSADDLAQILDAVESMESALAVEDRDAWVAADTRFHLGIVDMCGNRRLAAMYHAQRGLTDRARYFALYLRELPSQSTREHREMYEVLLRGDLVRLPVLYRQHWERTTNEILYLLERHGRGTPTPAVSRAL